MLQRSPTAVAPQDLQALTTTAMQNAKGRGLDMKCIRTTLYSYTCLNGVEPNKRLRVQTHSKTVPLRCLLDPMIPDRPSWPYPELDRTRYSPGANTSRCADSCSPGKSMFCDNTAVIGSSVGLLTATCHTCGNSLTCVTWMRRELNAPSLEPSSACAITG